MKHKKSYCNQHDEHHVDGSGTPGDGFYGRVIGRGASGTFQICTHVETVNNVWRREVREHLDGKDHPNGYVASEVKRRAEREG